MRLTIWSVAFWLMMAAIGEGQQIRASGLLSPASSIEGSAYTIQGTTPEREQVLRTQIEVMHPAVLPNRIIFVPHWQYISATRMYHLHVPTGMTSKMFTHLPSRSVYIDADFYGGDDWLGHWMAHELGHLERSNADEKEAEKSAVTYRRRLALKSSAASVTVGVFNDAAAPRLVVELAEQEASRIFLAAGLEITWVDCGARQENVPSGSCLAPQGPTHLNLRILPGGRKEKEDIFGVAFLAADGTGAYIDVFYDAIEKLHNESNASPGRLLGHVMAHEIGHLLIGSHAHSTSGIMCPVWSQRKLRSLEMGSLFFTENQGRTMKTRLLSAAVVVAYREKFSSYPAP